MMEWEDIKTAPIGVPVLVCDRHCNIDVASFVKDGKGYLWRRRYDHDGYGLRLEPIAWQNLPLPPREHYERKLAADILEKKLQELRS